MDKHIEVAFAGGLILYWVAAITFFALKDFLTRLRIDIRAKAWFL